MDINPSQEPLSEENFIREEYGKDPSPFWLWLCILAAVTASLWLGGSWLTRVVSTQFMANPFLQVTNRDFSLFLWQHPRYMRVHTKRKTGYLPAFEYVNRIGLKPSYAEEYVIVPPELLFLYHTWDRLIRDEYSPRPIPANEFVEFLDTVKEWQPDYWSQAPGGYVGIVKSLEERGDENLQALSSATLPFEVRRAFQGWKNYFKEGDTINAVRPTYLEVRAFLREHPHYARNYWRNIVAKETPNYLKNVYTDSGEGVVPLNELTPFIRVAVYNFLKSRQGE